MELSFGQSGFQFQLCHLFAELSGERSFQTFPFLRSKFHLSTKEGDSRWYLGAPEQYNLIEKVNMIWTPDYFSKLWLLDTAKQEQGLLDFTKSMENRDWSTLIPNSVF